ncbi:bifunctional DNA primase/polymerase [Sphingomonas sp. 22R3R2A-7]|uniref:bifunctional DNA primase/polymerase n=1 Tax=Sphingomonas sp. 22R3R2A-7 TaxID=3050230 RepID=UPI002FE31014
MSIARKRLSLVSSSCPANKTILDQVGELVQAGFAIHWLKPSSKQPAYGIGWPDAPVATVESLSASYEAGNNVGVRLGQPSALASGGFLHAIDIDIRIPELADEAWAAFATLFPGVARADLPEVRSGSDGASRHHYFVTDRPFGSKLLARSEGKHRRADGGWSNDWEIELFGTGKQLVLAPSIHPVTGKPYEWVRPFEFDRFEQPWIAADLIETLGAVDARTFPFETIPPATFDPGQLERELGLIPVSDLHYDDWIRTRPGAAPPVWRVAGGVRPLAAAHASLEEIHWGGANPRNASDQMALVR